jgi:hypothetical protein
MCELQLYYSERQPLTDSLSLTTVMGTVAGQSAYATDIVAVQRVYYNQSWSFGCTFPTTPAFSVSLTETQTNG